MAKIESCTISIQPLDEGYMVCFYWTPFDADRDHYPSEVLECRHAHATEAAVLTDVADFLAETGDWAND